MEVRRIADSLLRSRPSTILSFIVPSIPSIRSYKISTTFAGAPQVIRHFTTQPPHLQPSSAQAVAETEDNDPPQQTSSAPSSLPLAFDAVNSPPAPSRVQQISDILDDTMADYNYTSRAPKYKSPSAQSHQPTASSSSFMATQYKLAMAKTKPYDSHQGSVFSAMDKPSSPASNYNKSRAIERDVAVLTPRNMRTIRLSPSIGRTVDIDPASGMDLARGLRMLEIKCSVNKVRQDFAEQRFHERAGLKRKRLKSVRWRRKFRDAFQAVVGKVQDMRRRGW